MLHIRAETKPTNFQHISAWKLFVPVIRKSEEDGQNFAYTCIFSSESYCILLKKNSLKFLPR